MKFIRWIIHFLKPRRPCLAPRPYPSRFVREFPWREQLQAKMPPRERIEELAAKVPARDPWLDDGEDDRP
jgi:hypothetical protein